LLLIAVLVLAACRGQESPPAGAKLNPKPVRPRVTTTASSGDVGSPMPAYTAKWLDGSKFDLASEKGSVLLLNLWATWCAPCRFEIPELDKLHAKYADRRFKVIGVSVDEGGPADVKQFLSEQKISYPIAVDPEGKLATILHTSVLPTSVLIDRGGNVVWKHFGVVNTSDASLTQALESALAR
jgi:thiol-disulfide isomerase/thioredoxin